MRVPSFDLNKTEKATLDLGKENAELLDLLRKLVA